MAESKRRCRNRIASGSRPLRPIFTATKLPMPTAKTRARRATISLKDVGPHSPRDRERGSQHVTAPYTPACQSSDTRSVEPGQDERSFEPTFVELCHAMRHNIRCCGRHQHRYAIARLRVAEQTDELRNRQNLARHSLAQAVTTYEEEARTITDTGHGHGLNQGLSTALNRVRADEESTQRCDEELRERLNIMDRMQVNFENALAALILTLERCLAIRPEAQDSGSVSDQLSVRSTLHSEKRTIPAEVERLYKACNQERDAQEHLQELAHEQHELESLAQLYRDQGSQADVERTAIEAVTCGHNLLEAQAHLGQAVTELCEARQACVDRSLDPNDYLRTRVADDSSDATTDRHEPIVFPGVLHSDTINMLPALFAGSAIVGPDPQYDTGLISTELNQTVRTELWEASSAIRPFARIRDWVEQVQERSTSPAALERGPLLTRAMLAPLESHEAFEPYPLTDKQIAAQQHASPSDAGEDSSLAIEVPDVYASLLGCQGHDTAIIPRTFDDTGTTLSTSPSNIIEDIRCLYTSGQQQPGSISSEDATTCWRSNEAAESHLVENLASASSITGLTGPSNLAGSSDLGTTEHETAVTSSGPGPRAADQGYHMRVR